MTYLLIAVLLVLLLGATAIRHIAWWLFVVLPTVAYTAWQFAQAWHSPMYFLYAAVTVAFIVFAVIDVARQDEARADAGKPPLSVQCGHAP
jgi:hypothetical protein